MFMFQETFQNHNFNHIIFFKFLILFPFHITNNFNIINLILEEIKFCFNIFYFTQFLLFNLFTFHLFILNGLFKLN